MSTPGPSDAQASQTQPTQYTYHQPQGSSDALQQPSQSTGTLAASSSGTQLQTRQAAEDARKDRTLAEFLLMLDEYEPLVCAYLHTRY